MGNLLKYLRGFRKIRSIKVGQRVMLDNEPHTLIDSQKGELFKGDISRRNVFKSALDPDLYIKKV